MALRGIKPKIVQPKKAKMIVFGREKVGKNNFRSRFSKVLLY